MFIISVNNNEGFGIQCDSLAIIRNVDVTNNLGDALKTLSGLRILLKESNLLEDIFIGLEIPSPKLTFVLEYYCKQFILGHADLYRIKSFNELEALGIDNILERGPVLIEWPEKIKNFYENDTLEIRFKNINEKKSIELTNIKGWKKRISLIKSDHHG